jgi:hypothetical protein
VEWLDLHSVDVWSAYCAEDVRGRETCLTLTAVMSPLHSKYISRERV